MLLHQAYSIEFILGGIKCIDVNVVGNSRRNSLM